MSDSDGYMSPETDDAGLSWMDTSKRSPFTIQTVLGNSFKEISRRKTKHVIFQYALGKNFTAPVDEMLRQGAKVLNIEVSAGVWVADMAECFPTSHFVGIDLTNYKLKPSEFPDNCSFPRCNVIELPLPFEDSTFDYVYLRNALTTVPSGHYPNMLIELKRVLKPGGYLEWTEQDSLFRGGPLTTQFMTEIVAAFEQGGFDGRLGRHTHRLVASAGFADVRHNAVSIPIGSLWNEVIARAFSNDYQLGLTQFRPNLVPLMECSTEEYDQKLNAMVQEWNFVQKAYANHRIVVARKSLYSIDIDDPK